MSHPNRLLDRVQQFTYSLPKTLFCNVRKVKFECRYEHMRMGKLSEIVLQAGVRHQSQVLVVEFFVIHTPINQNIKYKAILSTLLT